MTREKSSSVGNMAIFCLFAGLLLGIVGGTVGALWYMLPVKSPVHAIDEQSTNDYRKREMSRELDKKRRAALEKDNEGSFFSRFLIWGGIGAAIGVFLGIPISRAYQSGNLPPVFDHIETVINVFYK